MNFQLKSLTLAQAATLQSDALVVLVPSILPQDSSALGTLIAQAVRSADLDLSKTGENTFPLARARSEGHTPGSGDAG